MSDHRAYQLYVHITWHTWRRVGCLDTEAARDVRIAVECAGRRSFVRILKMEVLADHVHVLISFRPNTRLSDFIRLAKTIAAFRANARVPGAIRWARGFYVASLHRRDLPRVDRYISRQYEHRDRIPARRSGRGLADPGARARGSRKGDDRLNRFTDPGRAPGDQ